MRRTCTTPRLKDFDYTYNNCFFVTSVVKHRMPSFGQVLDGKMILNNYGKIASTQWFWLHQNFPYILLHEFIVMPDHIHGIIEINDSIVVGADRKTKNVNVGAGRENIHVGVGAGRDLRLPDERDEQNKNINHQQKIKSLSEIMGAYKTTVSKQIHQAGLFSFNWQRSFYDHIIRDDNEFFWMSEYIRKNPENYNSTSAQAQVSKIFTLV
ncbi:MAG: hypothetical protein IPM74_14735 [Crocinitomicaceae bacterium]|nr:hypothetical protein [Crocinitomicaceae bacterium]MBK8927127.1 hypothetical protein [Crocinitomicaceae bacterium]